MFLDTMLIFPDGFVLLRGWGIKEKDAIRVIPMVKIASWRRCCPEVPSSCWAYTCDAEAILEAILVS